MKNMASIICLILCILATISIVTIASNEFKVVWRQPDGNNSTELYNQWATQTRFLVGDSLHFEYKGDSLLVVDKISYFRCNTTNPILAFKDGKTVIKLDKPGYTYFISGVPSHCQNGQRLIVDVMSPHPSTHSPSAISVPPQHFPFGSPAPAPESNSGGSMAATPVSVIFALAATAVTLLWDAPLHQ